MNRILIFITIFFLNFFMLNAEVVNKVEINGNKRVSDETIKVYGKIELNKEYGERAERLRAKFESLLETSRAA